VATTKEKLHDQVTATSRQQEGRQDAQGEARSETLEIRGQEAPGTVIVRASIDRESIGRDRDDAAEQRDVVGNERDLVGGERDDAADRRDAAADERDAITATGVFQDNAEFVQLGIDEGYWTQHPRFGKREAPTVICPEDAEVALYQDKDNEFGSTIVGFTCREK
jgi:hypothetical protein